MFNSTVKYEYTAQNSRNTYNNHTDKLKILTFIPLSKSFGAQLFEVNICRDFSFDAPLYMLSYSGPPEEKMKNAVGHQVPELNSVSRCSLTWAAEQGHLFDGISAIRAAP